MGSYSSKIVFSNSTQQPRFIGVEPWGEDYTLLPEEELEIITRDEAELPWFHVIERDDSTQVYIQTGSGFEVFQKGNRLECGHNRQAALDAGLTL